MASDEIRDLAQSYSGLQYVVTDPTKQWPWGSVPAVNEIVDLVRATPELLDRIAALEAEVARLTGALDGVVVCLTYDGVGDSRRYWIGSGQGAAFSAAIRSVVSRQPAPAHDCGRDHPDQDVYHPPTYSAALTASSEGRPTTAGRGGEDG